MLCPASAFWMLWFMRSPAQAAVPLARARVRSSVNCFALLGAEQLTVGLQRTARGHQHAVRIDAGFDQSSGLHVFLGGGKTVLQHGGNLVIAQSVGRLDVDARFHAADLLLG